MSIKEVEFIWMNGEYVKWNEAKIHVMTHCLHYGTGVFEGIRAYGSKTNLQIFRLAEHMDRLFNSAKLYYMEPQWSKKELADATIELLKKNNLRETCYIRPLIYRGYGVFGLNPLKAPVQATIITFPFGRYLEAEEGASCCITSWRRIATDTLPPESKACGNYVNSVLAKTEAVKNGFDEAIFLDAMGFVSEGSGENLFLAKNGTVFTTPTYSSILIGITRDTVIELCRDQGIEVVERPITRAELYYADEAFFTGTAAEVTPIIKIDHRQIGEGKIGPITNRLKDVFMKTVRGENEKYKDWLTPIY